MSGNIKRALPVILFILFLLPGLLPLAGIFSDGLYSFLSTRELVLLNLTGWLAVALALIIHGGIRERVYELSKRLKIERESPSFEVNLSSIVKEIDRRNAALSTDYLACSVKTEYELSESLQKIVALAYELLNAEAVELALFDELSEMYHSAFLAGKPFRRSSQAMLSGAVDGDEDLPSPDVIIREIVFAGTILGSLRIALQRDRLPSHTDIEIVRILALQASLVIINSEYTRELVRMRRASEESIRAKTGFLANLSHGIRGPLGIIVNAVELVLDGLCGDISEEQAETLKMVSSNGEHLLDLINDVLDYARIESGVLTPNIEDLPVKEVLKDIVGVVKVQAESKSHNLVFEAPNEDLAVKCDRRHFRQMLINLLTNAIKYTPAGGKICVSVERAAGGRVQINVKDSGIGIEASEQYRVFSAFERVENDYSLTQQGTGLGMPLTRKLAEANGGTIDFRSEAGAGSHFWIVLSSAEQPVKKRTAAKSEKVDGKGNVILLIESNTGERGMLVRYLSSCGYKVIPAENPGSVMGLLRNGKIDLVMLDNAVLEGLEEDLIEVIREEASSSFLPVVLMSSRAFVDDVEKYLKAGVDLCLIKPITLKKMGALCRRLIDREYRGGRVDEGALNYLNVGEGDIRPAEDTISDTRKSKDLLH